MKLDWTALKQSLARPPVRVADEKVRRAAVAVVIRESATAEDDELLFIRRAVHPRDPWSGQMGFPGGRAEPSDRHLEETARRETREEVGLELEAHATTLGPLDEVRAMARLRPQNLAISPFVYRLESAAEARPGPEVASIHWLPLDRLFAPGTRSILPYEHEGATLHFPCLRLDDLVIWGLTLRMLGDLAQRLGLPDQPDRLGRE